MDDSIESQQELVFDEFLRDNSFDSGSEPEGEPRFHASSDLRESGEDEAGAGDDSFPSLTELRESIVSTLDASIAKFDGLLSHRGIVQPQRLFKLSDELLGMILGFLAEPQLSELLLPFAFNRVPNGVKRMRNLKTASPFLLPTVRVEMTAQSLARLDMISRHPNIGKGVRTVRVITHCLDRMSIDSFESFRHHKFGYLSEALERVVSDAVPTDEGEESRMSWELYRRYILDGSGDSINESILHNRPYVFDGSDDSITDKNLRQIFWSKAYERYKYLLAEQESLTEEDVFLEGVGTAVARMPRATTLHICDRDRDNFYDYRPHPRLYSTSKLLFDYYENEDVLIDDIIKSKLFGYEDDDDSYLRTDTSWSSPSAQILLKLPGAIHKAGRSLENICIEIRGPSDYRTLASSEDFQELSAATQRLKQFTFYCTYNEDDEDDQWTPTELDGLVKYLSAIVNTNALEKIDINLSYLAIGLGNLDMEKPNPSVPSLGTILTSRMWPNLRSIYLSRVPLHLSELETFIDNLKSSDIEMDIQYMYLISGSWSDGLEIFKNWSLGSQFQGRSAEHYLPAESFFGAGQAAILLGLWPFATGN
ncbi:hypothetical protein BCON_0164g00010 [Botryotinia convoluta]|uniref:Uncharacterized protein n=1 Tax=Botryotinia convoluta TaxID=54673 RepID=A0A4Z1HQB1_9HELO|nr:hypothetical protein BCON_0164g00010 [Botryotinia convoluta]